MPPFSSITPYLSEQILYNDNIRKNIIRLIPPHIIHDIHDKEQKFISIKTLKNVIVKKSKSSTKINKFIENID